MQTAQLPTRPAIRLVRMNSSRRQYIVNADDFGSSPAGNAAIAQAFDEGLISSTSIMANMSGFEQACEITCARNLHGAVGVHLNLTAGAPLTADIRSTQHFVDDKGTFSFALPRTTLSLTRQELTAVRREWDAQIRRCLDNGISPSHLDSHHHVHSVWPLLSVTMDLARTFRIPFVRISRNIGVPPGLAKSLYKAIMNWRLRQAGLAGSKYFGAAEDFVALHQKLTGSIEMMVHLYSAQDVSPLRNVIDNLGIAGRMLSHSEAAKERM